jgi:uroporphyrinogen III methyltransferase/synthase
MNKKGMVYLVGAGPGDMELITKKGERLLQSCDVIIYDRLASMELLDLVPESSELIYVGKTVGNHAIKQEEINQIIVRKALENKKVLRLKGGDPFVFGRGGEEVLALQEAGISYEVVPGVTSVTSVLASAGIPITHRGSSNSFHVITGHTKDSDNELTDNFETLAKLDGTLVFLMGIGNLKKIVDQLISYGKNKNTPAAVIANGTMINQKVVRGTLDTIYDIVVENHIEAPAIIVIGNVASLHMEKTSTGSLQGKRIGITGTNKLTNKLKVHLEEHGANVINLSFLRVEESCNQEEILDAMHNISRYSWITFTSANGVDIFFNKIKKEAIDYRVFANIRFAVVGQGTKDALLKEGFQADYMPQKYTTTELAEGLLPKLQKDDRVLLARAKEGSKDLNEILLKSQGNIHDLAIYEIKTDESKKISILNSLTYLDAITFASSSGVTSFIDGLETEQQNLLKQLKIFCIGDITANTLESRGYSEYVIANEYTAEGLAEVISESFEKKEWSHE